MSSGASKPYSDDDIVLTGMSGRLPESDSIEEFAEQLFVGTDLVTSDDRRWPPGIFGLPKRNGKLKDLTHFDAAYFSVHSKQVQVMDPQLRLLLEVTHEAIIDAGINPTELRGSRTGVFVGIASSESQEYWSRNVDKIDLYVASGGSRSLIPNRVSYVFDFKGPSYAIDSACASSLYAMSQAAAAIRSGECDAAVVAACNLCLHPTTSVTFHCMKALSEDGKCATFDESRSGFVRSEAVVAVLLQRRSAARRVYCSVRSAQVNTDGYKEQGITYPIGASQSRLAEQTLKEAGVRPQDVAYIEAHGTGTKVGDREEVNAIAELFCAERSTPLLIGSVKSNMGHAEAASGMCSIVKLVLAMERGVIPGNLHYRTPNPEIPALSDGRIKVVDRNMKWNGGLVAVKSSGLGGTNAQLLLESNGGGDERPVAPKQPIPRLVLVSGRTESAVERLLALAIMHSRDAELQALLDAIHAHPIPRHPSRGYAVLTDPPYKKSSQYDIDDGPRPVWFVFSGMGSQWAGMARDLLHLPIFAESIERCAAALRPVGLDLHSLLTIEPDHAFETNMIYSFVTIAAVQVALVDLLRAVGITPDGIIGHSLGEIGCAYADETLTAEQTVLCAYWRGQCTVDSKPMPGAMASIGMSWHEVSLRCPPDVDLACNNCHDNVTVSGPTKSIDKFLSQLSSEGVFTQRVKTSNVAFHSKYITSVAPLLYSALKRVISSPKPRSARWLSSSLLEDQWNSDLAKFSDAAYHVNNLVSPVHFTETVRHVPANALVLEVAPQALLQPVLRRALPSARYVPLIRRDAPNALVHLLRALGKAYAAGAQPRLSALYPPVKWPVSRGTPGLASHIQWDHSALWPVYGFKENTRDGVHVYSYDLSCPDDVFLTGHSVDGRLLFPAAGYLVLAWRTVAKIQNLKLEETCVILEDIKFHRATVISLDSPVHFAVAMLNCSGNFEVSEGGNIVVTGTARLVTNSATERSVPTELSQSDLQSEENELVLCDDDIYKDLLLQGFHYQGMFRGVKKSNLLGTRGELAWNDNWITFIDTMLQLKFVSTDFNDLHLPTQLHRVLIDPVAHRAAIAAANDGIIPVRSYVTNGVTVAGGIELCLMNTMTATRRPQTQKPKLERYEFCPFTDTKHTNRIESSVLTTALQLVLENCPVQRTRVVEPALGRPADMLLLSEILQILEAEPMLRIEAQLAGGADHAQYSAAMEHLNVKVTNKDVTVRSFEADNHLVLGTNILSQHKNSFDVLASWLAPNGMMLLRESLEQDEVEAYTTVTEAGLICVWRHRVATCDYIILRRVPHVPVQHVLVEVTDNGCYDWVDALRKALKRAETENIRVYLWSRVAHSGVLGLGKCLRREVGGEALRVYYLPNCEEPFAPNAPTYFAQVAKDLPFNVLRGGIWGTYSHVSLTDIDNNIQVENASIKSMTQDERSSLRWIESDVSATSTLPGAELCRVYYAPLNYRDIMLTTGKLPPTLLPNGKLEQEYNPGLEYSGKLTNGKRVMGVLEGKAMATNVVVDPELLYEVPADWSLEEAATVPIAYMTAYYALIVRGHMISGETVLIHAGTGGVGQAAIAVALHAGCTVFTTVGTPAKRAFLRERFPSLPDDNIGNSRDCSFEELVMSRTNGRGVDLVLNSLSGDQLQASVRCLAFNGRFLEIGQLDMFNSSSLSMEVFLKNATVHGVLLNVLIARGPNYRNPDILVVVRLVTEGIAAGVVRPLPTTVFEVDQVEQAFRYMGSSKHIGKVMIRVRKEDASPEALIKMSVQPYSHMRPDRSYILVGGLGGFGLELGSWLVRRGARVLVLNSRSGVCTGYQALCIRRWRKSGVDVILSTIDVTTKMGARAVLMQAATKGPVAGVFNLAAVLHDAELQNLKSNDFQLVAKPKFDATIALDAATRQLAPQLEHFVMFSSMACGRGNAGQSNYGYANSCMERICELRRADGLPGLAVQWGAIGDVGLIMTAMHGDNETQILGTKPQRIASCMDTLDSMLSLPYAVTSSMVLVDKQRGATKADSSIVQSVANILGIKDLKKVPASATLPELGMDSLMATEIRQLLDHKYDVQLNAQETRALTFGKLESLKKASRI